MVHCLIHRRGYIGTGRPATLRDALSVKLGRGFRQEPAGGGRVGLQLVETEGSEKWEESSFVEAGEEVVVGLVDGGEDVVVCAGVCVAFLDLRGGEVG